MTEVFRPLTALRERAYEDAQRNTHYCKYTLHLSDLSRP